MAMSKQQQKRKLKDQPSENQQSNSNNGLSDTVGACEVAERVAKDTMRKINRIFADVTH